MATMLTRVLKAAYIPGWTLPTDGQFRLNFSNPTPFADDSFINGYARESVYFMVANGVISGLGNNRFGPNAASASGQPAGYANATREQSLILAAKIVVTFEGQPLNYTR